MIDYNLLLNAVMGFMTAPTWKAFVVMIGVIAICILAIAKYFYDKNAREKEQYEFNQKIRQTQEENVGKMQKDIIASLLQNIDLAYKQDYDYYVKKITDKNFSAIYLKAPIDFHAKISEFLYREDLKPEEKSALIIDAIRRK